MSDRRLSRSRSLRRSGFTIIEVIVTVIVLAVVLGVAAPRLLSGGGDRARVTAESVAESVSDVARRSGLGSERLAISYEHPDEPGRSGVVRVLSFRVPPTERRDDGEPRWMDDPFIGAVELERVELSRAVIDGVEIVRESFRVDIEPGQVRPDLRIELAETGSNEGDAGDVWAIELPSYGSRAVLIDPRGEVVGGAGGDAGRLRPLDLDADGDGEAAW